MRQALETVITAESEKLQAFFIVQFPQISKEGLMHNFEADHKHLCCAA